MKWDFYRTVATDVSAGAGVDPVGNLIDYADNSSQSLYIEYGDIMTRTAQISDDDWEHAELDDPIIISVADPDYNLPTASAWTLAYSGMLYGALRMGDSYLRLVRYGATRNLTDLVRSGSIKLRRDSQITQLSLRLINSGEAFFLGSGSIFVPGSKLVVTVSMGSSGEYDLGVFYLDELNYDRDSAEASVSGRNAIGFWLNSQTFDSNTFFVGNGHEAAAFILELGGITRYEIGPSFVAFDWNFAPEDTLYKGLQKLFEFYPGWAMIELPDGRICIGYPDFLAQYQANGVYSFAAETDISRRRSKLSADAVYAKVRVTGKDADGVELTPVEVTTSILSGWDVGAQKTRHVKAADGLTQYDLQSYAEQLATDMQNIGVNDTFDGPMRPWLLPGDIASISSAGGAAVNLGLITSVTHTFGVTGFFTSFSVDSGGVYYAQSRADQTYATRSASVNGYNRRQDLADLIGVIAQLAQQ